MRVNCLVYFFVYADNCSLLFNVNVLKKVAIIFMCIERERKKERDSVFFVRVRTSNYTICVECVDK